MTAIANLPDLRPSLLLDFANSGRVDPRIQCTRASAATCYGADGKLRTVAANVPRIDYDPVTGKCLGLLVEESRTNLWLYSAAASAAQSFSVTAQSYTLSFEGTGSISLTGAISANTSSGTATGVRRTLTFTPAAGTLVCAPSGDVRNVQLEAGPFRTSFIPTEASAVTRAADALVVEGANFSAWYNQHEGTVISVAKTDNPSNSRYVWQVIKDNVSNHRMMSAATSGAAFKLYINMDGATENLGNKAYVPNVYSKVAVGYKSGDHGVSVDGGECSTSSSSVLISPNRMQIGSYVQNALCGHIAKIAYYSKRLSNAQLQRLTA